MRGIKKLYLVLAIVTFIVSIVSADKNLFTKRAKKDDDDEEESGEHKKHKEDEEPVCSTADHDDSKTCISIKFPWKDDSVYFCTDSNHLTYTTQCEEDNAVSNRCFGMQSGKHDLKIITPWDCCPIVSKTNHCEDANCQLEPYNRTCKATKKTHECCTSYFCDKGDSRKCKMQRTKSQCINPPKGKVNCTAFADPFGCCNKFQCQDEGKDGECPTSGEDKVNALFDKVASVASKWFGAGAAESGREALKIPTMQRCVGDYTCPGKKKCCPVLDHGQKWTVSHVEQKGKGKKKQMIRAIHGVCMEPAKVMEEETSGEETTEAEPEAEEE